MKKSKFLQKLEKAIADNNIILKETAAASVVAGEDNVQEDAITVFKKKLEAFAQSAEELDNAWDFVDGNPDVKIDNGYPFKDELYYVALKNTRIWAKNTAKNLK